MDKSYDTSFDFHTTKTLISGKKGRSSFTSTITPFDEKKDGKWVDSDDETRKAFLKVFKSQAPNIKIETSTGTENIGGLKFRSWYLLITYPNKTVMKSYTYTELYKGYVFTICINYADEETGEELKQMIASSKF